MQQPAKTIVAARGRERARKCAQESRAHRDERATAHARAHRPTGSARPHEGHNFDHAASPGRPQEHASRPDHGRQAPTRWRPYGPSQREIGQSDAEAGCPRRPRGRGRRLGDFLRRRLRSRARTSCADQRALAANGERLDRRLAAPTSLARGGWGRSRVKAEIRRRGRSRAEDARTRKIRRPRGARRRRRDLAELTGPGRCRGAAGVRGGR